MSAIISYRKKIAIWRFIIAFVAVFLSLWHLTNLNIFSAVFYGFFAVSACYTTGAELDLASKMYRETSFILGIKFGTWRRNPQFEYVSVFRTTETQTVNYASISTDVTSGIIVLNVFYGNKHITFFSTQNKEEAFDKARQIAISLEIDVLDATTREKVWLDRNLQPI
jgi:hypothetical protein